MAWRWLVLGEVLVVVSSMLSVSTGVGRHKFDAMIEPLLVTTLVQYVLLVFVFCREDMWVYISHLLIALIPLVLYWLIDRCRYPPVVGCCSP